MLGVLISSTFLSRGRKYQGSGSTHTLSSQTALDMALRVSTTFHQVKYPLSSFNDSVEALDLVQATMVVAVSNRKEGGFGVLQLCKGIMGTMIGSGAAARQKNMFALVKSLELETDF
jgi:hypothetical protein